MPNLRTVGKNAVLFEAICGPKFVEFRDIVVSKSFPASLRHISYRRHLPLNLRLIFEVFEIRGR